MSKSSLLDMLDQVRPELEPLDPHYMAQQAELEQNRYLTLLVANLLEERTISEAQSRLLDMLLTSMAVKHPVNFYLKQAAALNRDELKETIIFLKKDEQASNSYIFDLMILLRVNGALTTQRCDELLKQFTILAISNIRSQRLMYWFESLIMGLDDLKGDDIADDFIVMDKIVEEIFGSFYFRGQTSFKVGDLTQDFICIKYSSTHYGSRTREVKVPAGRVTQICSNAVQRNEGGIPAIRIIPFPMGLNAWWSMISPVNNNRE
ncbi:MULTISPECIES: hypothetical protein [Aeromonas]|uniref:hypothetical protein n=1 Tax=Aeromonas TaxID=642 RepID=UPI001BCD946F|nr:hypothetical protein [Aeromonas caviae]MBS4711039.1 hypothetical protein [Aeromonas caviae]